MENALGKMLTELAGGVDEVAAATKPGDSRIKRNIVGLPDKWLRDTTGAMPLPPMTLERLYLPQMHFETDLVSALDSSSSDDPAISWLLEPRSWAYLLLSGTIEPGSFQDVVIFQWVRSLVVQRQASAKARVRFSHNLRICAAVLGLAMFVFPPAALLAVPAVMAVTADHIHYAASQLAGLDASIRALLPEPRIGRPGDACRDRQPPCRAAEDDRSDDQRSADHDPHARGRADPSHRRGAAGRRVLQRLDDADSRGRPSPGMK